MALIVCKECGGKVSTEAQACPACGAARPKRTSTLTWVIAGFFVIALVMGIGASNTQRQTAAAAQAAKAPAQIASEAAAKAANTHRFGAAQATSTTLRRAAREPESVKFDSLRVNEDGTVVCAEFRGRNGFGGMGLEHIAAVNGKLDSSLTTWNRLCTKAMYNYLSAAE